MIERFIHHVRVERPGASERAAEARERLRDKFPPSASRRMTHLGLLMGSAFDGLPIEPDDAVIYATSFAETRTLEDYLSSFPAASPSLFQTSIHPGAIQQVLIGRKQPLRRLWPLAGCARLVEQALTTALLEPGPRAVLAGGEERGTWMLDRGMASERAFAFVALLSPESVGAAGRVAFAPADALRDGACPSLAALADALAERRVLSWNGAGGRWALDWL